MDIGILGAGAIGGNLASLFTQAGHRVMVSSRHPGMIAAQAAAGGYKAGSLEDAIQFGHVVIAALPFHSFGAIPPAPLVGRTVIDTMNYYPDERDPRVPELDVPRSTTTSELVARHLPGTLLVKAFNAILAADLPRHDRPSIEGRPARLPMAGNDAAAKAIVAALHQDIGFEALDAGTLANSWRFERAKPAYCMPLDAVGLRQHWPPQVPMRNCHVTPGSAATVADKICSDSDVRSPLHESCSLATDLSRRCCLARRPPHV